MEKRKAIELLAAEQAIDLASSYAYSDHHADLDFLQAVGYPVAVNPTKKLMHEAKKRNWSVLSLEKNER